MKLAGVQKSYRGPSSPLQEPVWVPPFPVLKRWAAGPSNLRDLVKAAGRTAGKYHGLGDVLRQTDEGG